MEFATILGLFAVFVTVSSLQPTVNLRTAGNYVILAKTAISTSGTTAITGDLGISPAASTYITGFSLTSPSTYSTSSLVTGKVYAPDYTAPTASQLTTAIGDMVTAYNDAAGRINPDYLNLNTGNLNGLTLTPGLYKWTTPLTLGGTITLNGNGNSSSVFIFQTSGTLNFGGGSIITLSGGAVAQNIFWQSASTVTLAASSAVQGNILASTDVVFMGSASLKGKTLAQTAVSLIGNTLTYV